MEHVIWLAIGYVGGIVTVLWIITRVVKRIVTGVTRKNCNW